MNEKLMKDLQAVIGVKVMKKIMTSVVTQMEVQIGKLEHDFTEDGLKSVFGEDYENLKKSLKLLKDTSIKV